MKPKFNQTNENVDWARWTWNPATGCENGCEYCYARDIANRFYPEKFKPTFRPERLPAPYNTNPRSHKDLRGKNLSDNELRQRGYFNVFTCSMGDLCGPWSTDVWVEAILRVVRQTPVWTYLFLTKFPERLASVKWPGNAWVGATVDRQDRVARTEKAFKQFKAPVKFVSCEPLLEEIHFSTPELFDWIIIGGRSRNTRGAASQPERLWVYNLLGQAMMGGCKVYCKPNLRSLVKEYPKGAGTVPA